MKKCYLVVLILFIGLSTAFAQTRVTGKVTGADGQPISFVHVHVQGVTKAVTQTSDDGTYVINVPQGGTQLVYTFIGYKTITVNIVGKSVINVVMESDALAMDDLIVVAYGVVEKKSFTGSASVISSDKIASRPSSNVGKSLAGVVAGVQIASPSGQPGSGANIRIRGVGSISAGQNPLIVLDGVPYDGSLNSINNADIESMTVLKDAAANSMYGARGANGVLMITTKSGKKGRANVSFEARVGVNQRGTPAYDVMRDPGQYMELEWESLKNSANARATADPALWASQQLISNTYGTGGYNPYGNVSNDQVVLPNGKLNPAAKLMYWDDWIKDPLENGLRQEYIASVSGSNDNTSYYMSLSYLDDNSYVPNSGFERYTARVKVDRRVNAWFKAGMNLAYAKSYQSTIGGEASSSYVNLFMFGQNIAPYYPIWQYNQQTGALLLDAQGNKMYDYGSTMGKRAYGGTTNPLSALNNDIRGSDRDQVTAMGYADITFLKDFVLTINMSAENYNYFSNSFQTPVGGDALNVNGRNYRGSAKNFVLNAQQLLRYRKSFSNHNFDVLLGHETFQKKYNYLEGSKENFLIPDNPELINAARILDVYSYQEDYALNSWLSQLSYNYANKYFLSGSFRRDGSSRFHPDNRWGNFWSVGGSWRVDQENFMTASWLDALKLKASYGTQGNDDIGRYNAYSDQYSVVSQSGSIGITYVYRGVADLTWENSNNANIGIEFGFWNRLRGSLDYYNKLTKDLLYQKTLPGSMGSPNWIWDNAISMTNQGFELELSYDVLKSEDFYWNLSANITSQKNKITKLPADRDPEGKGYRAGNFFYKVGNSIYDYYLYESAGVDPETGKALWWQDIKDAEGNITESKTTDIYSQATYRENGKHALPDYYGGISTNFAWKGIDLAVACSYQIGGWALDGTYQGLMHNFSAIGNNLHTDALGRWTTPGQITDIPRLEFALVDQNATSDRFLTSNTAFYLQNITLGYTLPKSLTDKMGISKLRIYATGDNLWMKSARQGYDPSYYITGGTGNNYSSMRTLLLGLSLNF